MGWKLAIVLSKLDGRSLEAFVAEIYGKPQKLSPSGVGVDSAFYPRDTKDRYALSYAGCGWIFDWELVDRVFDAEDALKTSAATWSFVLHSGMNMYGFAKHEKGAFVRCRWGSHEDGIARDVGEPLPLERATVTASAKPGSEEAAWAAWMDVTKSFAGTYDEYTHDVVGEDVVMRLIAEATGFRMDMDNATAIKLWETEVLAIEKERRSGSPLFGLFGKKR